MRPIRLLLSIAITISYVSIVKAQFIHETYISDQSFISSIAISADGRMYFIEKQTGLVKVVLGQNSVRSDPFFQFNVDNAGERGGLGLTFHPNYPDSPYVYCYITAIGPILANIVVRLTDSLGYGTHPDTILRAPITVSATNHNGGYLRFGPEGKLYITMGENGQSSWAQDTCRMQGKILRINYDGSIPSDNPIHCAPIFSYGNRNSFGFCFHPATGVLYESENGPDANDEINRILPGRNYGWPNVQCRSDNPTYENAIFCWTPTIAPTGITLAWNSAIPEFNGKLLMTDYNTGTLHLLTLNQAGDLITSDDHIFSSGFGLIDVKQGTDGYFYLSGADGSITRIRPNNAGPRPFGIYGPRDYFKRMVDDSALFIWGNTTDSSGGNNIAFWLQYSRKGDFSDSVSLLRLSTDTVAAVSVGPLAQWGPGHVYWRILAIDSDSMVTIGGVPNEEIRNLFLYAYDSSGISINWHGDVNASGQVNGLDVIYLRKYLKGNGSPPEPFFEGDVNGDCIINFLDLSYLLNFIKAGPEPQNNECPQ